MWHARLDARPLAEALLTVMLPPRCGSCGAPMVARSPDSLCRVCRELVELNDGPRCGRCDLPSDDGSCERCRTRAPAFDGVRAPYIYGGAIRDLVLRAKFRGREDLAQALAHLLSEELRDLPRTGAESQVAPVPLALRRRLLRGYNPSAVIARHVARVLGGEVRYLLLRSRGTRAQSGLTLAERRTNVQQAFVAPRAVRGSVILVDDVVTSGETAHHAALALKQAGAQAVWVVALARATLPT
ncbi:MAG: ComF family protein [Myxococcota bacterium]